MHNVWMGSVEKDVTSESKIILSDGLEEIESHYCVSTDLIAVMFASHEEFSLAVNYPKGHREIFHDWMKENYLSEFLFHFIL